MKITRMFVIRIFKYSIDKTSVSHMYHECNIYVTFYLKRSYRSKSALPVTYDPKSKTFFYHRI